MYPFIVAKLSKQQRQVVRHSCTALTRLPAGACGKWMGIKRQMDGFRRCCFRGIVVKLLRKNLCASTKRSTP
jgi:hypothetical protein